MKDPLTLRNKVAEREMSELLFTIEGNPALYTKKANGCDAVLIFHFSIYRTLIAGDENARTAVRTTHNNDGSLVAFIALTMCMLPIHLGSRTRIN